MGGNLLLLCEVIITTKVEGELSANLTHKKWLLPLLFLLCIISIVEHSQRDCACFVFVLCQVVATAQIDRTNLATVLSTTIQNNAVLKQWIHNIGWLNLTLNNHTGVCSVRLANTWGRTLCPDKVQNLKLAVLATKVSLVPTNTVESSFRHEAPTRKRNRSVVIAQYKDTSMDTELYWSRSWTVWEPVMWNRTESTSSSKSPSALSMFTLVYLYQTVTRIIVSNDGSTWHTKETFVARKVSFKVGTSSGWKIRPWALPRAHSGIILQC